MIALLAVLAACGEDKEGNKEPKDIVLEEDEKVDEEKIVITINEEDVNGKQYNTTYLQTKILAYQLGQDIDDKENIKDITLNEIIAQELIKQEAEKHGILPSEELVQEELDALKEQGEEQFNAYKEQFGLTEESLKDQIRFKQILNQFIDQEIEVEEVTEEEIKEAYDNLKEDMENIMEYEEAEPIIKDQLTQQREADALKVRVEELMETAEIKKHI